MNKLLLTILTLFVAITFWSCDNSQKDKTKSFFEGHLLNTKDSLVVLYFNEKPIDTAVINQDNSFTFIFNDKNRNLYNFSVDGQYKYLFIEPGDSIVMYANMLNFNDTLSFSGKGASINNFIASQFYQFENSPLNLRELHLMEPKDFKRKIDSLKKIKSGELEKLFEVNPTLSEKAKTIAIVSATAFLDKELEVYPFLHQRQTLLDITNVIPEDFYSYRDSIDYNNSLLQYYRPYYSYMVMFVNNVAFLEYKKNNTPEDSSFDINKVEDFHFNKLDIIDSVFAKGSLRDNIYRNAAYAYLFNIQDEENNKKYIKAFEKYNKNSNHKDELSKVFDNIISLQKGKTPPNIELIDTKGNTTSLQKILKPQISVFYFWSTNQVDFSGYIHNRVLQLKDLYPEVHFIGINIGQDEELWLKGLPGFKIDDNTEQYSSKNFKDLSQKLLIYNLNKSLVIDKNGKIITAFENIFSPEMENILSESTEN